MLLLGLSEEGVLWMCFHTADRGWRGALPSWSFPSPGGEASKNNLSGIDPHPPGPSQEHLAAAPLPTVSWCHQASHPAGQGHESSGCLSYRESFLPWYGCPLHTAGRVASGGIPDFLEWKQFLEDKIVTDRSPGGGRGGGPGLGGLLVPLPCWSRRWHGPPGGPK